MSEVVDDTREIAIGVNVDVNKTGIFLIVIIIVAAYLLFND